jgi:hypothetical protein
MQHVASCLRQLTNENNLKREREEEVDGKGEKMRKRRRRWLT